MGRRAGAATSPLTWVLTLVLLAVLDIAITRTGVLWGPTPFENLPGPREVFRQTYLAARRIYAPERPAEVRVVLLGNSRIALPARAATLERELRTLDPALDVRIDNLGIFGAHLNDIEVLSRHLHRVEPTLAVLAVAGEDLLRVPTDPLEHPVSRLLSVGFDPGPLPPPGLAPAMDRWLRTLWPLYRFREFTRAVLEARVLGPPDPGPGPERIASTLEHFALMHGERAPQVETVYRAWRADGGLDAFVRYLEVGSPDHLAARRARAREEIDLEGTGPNLRVLDVLLRRLRTSAVHTRILILPENPLLAGDAAAELHRPGLSAATAALIRDAAARRGVAVVDARAWMPARAFLDLDHLFADVSGFQTPLAREILNAIES